MTRIYKILRAILVTALAVGIAVALLVYMLLSIGSVQRSIADVAERELTSLIGADVNIGSLELTPFNKLTLGDVSVTDCDGDTVMKAQRIGAGILLGKLLLQQRVIISFAEIIGLDVSLSRDSLSAPLNIQPIIDRLSSNDPNKEPTQFSLRINNIVMRRCAFSYDVLSEPHRDTFDPSHISVTGLRADIMLPRISNDAYRIDLRRLAFRERSGLIVESLAGRCAVTDTLIALDGLKLELPGSLLDIAPIEMSVNGLSDLGTRICKLPFRLRILDDTHFTPADFAAFVPGFSENRRVVRMNADIEGPVDSMTIHGIDAYTDDRSIIVNVAGMVSGLPERDSVKIDFPRLELKASGSTVASTLSEVVHVSGKVNDIILRSGTLSFDGSLAGSLDKAVCDAVINTDYGRLVVDAEYSGSGRSHRLKGDIDIRSLDVGTLLATGDVGKITASVAADCRITGGKPYGSVDVDIDTAVYKGHTYTAAILAANFTGDGCAGHLSIGDESLKLDVGGTVTYSRHRVACDIEGHVRDFNPNALNLTGSWPGYTMSADLDAHLDGAALELMDGRLAINRFRFTDCDGHGVTLDNFTIRSSGTTTPRYIQLSSDVADAQLTGTYKFNKIAPTVKSILASVFPALLPGEIPVVNDDMTADLSLTLKEGNITNRWLDFVKSPVKILSPATVQASLQSGERQLKLTADVPNLLQKDKFIDSTRVSLFIDGKDGDADFHASTLYPTKKGIALLDLSADGGDDRVSAGIGWHIERDREFGGEVDLGAAFSRDGASRLISKIDINESRLIFNDTAWVIHPASVIVENKRIAVNDIHIGRTGQYVKIDGIASESPDDILSLKLRDISLDYVFETLDIPNVAFGGVATGDFYMSQLFSPEPHLETPNLHVNDFSYNHAPFGNADIVSRWDNENKGVSINATIYQPNSRITTVDGAIYPMAEALDFRFNADKLNVKFMKPYMEAFTSDVDGFASGEARLFGTFKYIDMTGDIWAEDLKLKLDFTNTYYTTTDSIHLTPGRISFNDAVLHDRDGHTARLDGWVTHKYFKEPEFEFRVSDAHDFLCFNITEKINPVWYGTVYCNGGALVKGVPGFIDMNINISTAPKSEFTFVLTDSEAADDYTFMTFHDRDAITGDLLLSVEDPHAAAIKRMREYFASLQQQDDNPSVYRINLQLDANPNGEMILVMDPEGGDRIRARGDGNLRIEYNSADDDMRMFGTYTLSQGNYNFTLQDIIIKDFTIKPGSSITFQGDPLKAILDISAVYAVNANLSDLDESFLQDRELTRTNVPVHALLKVTGDMQQPDIDFDLEFPTLTQDTYRKVKSIVSTEDMMNRQIIYLLALNRFYTPDYMGGTTKGNELVSVASSTISSQLASMLGQLSDNWTIAPNFRSDRGDFSDMEVDLALSSYLLNNRLLFNGNFGYRDNAMNNNSFIGDFDIEYLLNKSGNIRLKAYNRYNDQNYYLRSALTTQGVGVVFMRDFDDIFSFWKRWRRKRKK